ncbi:MAG: glycerophosphodiester phosphodiesterase family protein [Alphaproteobacteria bacterium]|nr:glycerophosphodiester phosphodiesterase family protein [Alphaproteobacteria bacterium]
MKRADFLKAGALSIAGLSVSNLMGQNSKLQPIAHTKPINPREGLKITGHRGYRGLAPEHTMEGYIPAANTGVDVLDMDVHFTKDRVPVCLHDPYLNPDFTTHADDGLFVSPNFFLVKAMTYDELLKFRVGTLNPNSEYFRIFTEQVAFSNAKIPRVEDVFRKFKNTHLEFQCEIKLNPYKQELYYTPVECVKMLLEVGDKCGVLDRMQVQSFNWETLTLAKQLCPGIRTSALTAIDYEVEDYHKQGLWLGGRQIQNFPSKVAMVDHLGAWSWDAEDVELTPELVKECHDKNIVVKVWNNPQTFPPYVNQLLEKYHIRNNKVPYPQLGNWPNPTLEQLMEWGVDYIITDRPDVARGIATVKGYRVANPHSII